MFHEAISSGRALARFREIILLQGGEPRVTENYGLFPQAKHRGDVAARCSGYIQSMETQQIGLALCVIGAGRETVDSEIDPAVGIRFHKKICDRVEPGESLCTVYYNDERRCREAAQRLADSYAYSATPPERPAMVKLTIRGDV